MVSPSPGLRYRCDSHVANKGTEVQGYKIGPAKGQKPNINPCKFLSRAYTLQLPLIFLVHWNIDFFNFELMLKTILIKLSICLQDFSELQNCTNKNTAWITRIKIKISINSQQNSFLPSLSHLLPLLLKYEFFSWHFFKTCFPRSSFGNCCLIYKYKS